MPEAIGDDRERPQDAIASVLLLAFGAMRL